jgi:hypothetical protein
MYEARSSVVAKRNGLPLASATIITESDEIGTYASIVSEEALMRAVYRLTISITCCLSVYASFRVHLLGGVLWLVSGKEACAGKEDA